MMMPHHQGIIGMTRASFRDGGAPFDPRMAQQVIADQERKVREFRAWQAEHPVPDSGLARDLYPRPVSKQPGGAGRRPEHA